MNRALLTLASSLAVAFAAASAEAGMLTSATWTTQVTGLFGTGTFGVPVAGTGTASASSVSVGLTVPAFSAESFGQGSFLTFRAISLQGTQQQALTATAAGAKATMAVEGRELVGAAAHTASSMLVPGATYLVRVPLRVGVSDVFTSYIAPLGNYHLVTVDFYGWSPGTRTFTGLTLQGSPIPDVVAMGSFDVNASGAGQVSLVAPARITIAHPSGGDPFFSRRTVSLTTLKLSFVPEPGTLLLLAAAALALLRRARAG